jgi:hypothetical protein
VYDGNEMTGGEDEALREAEFAPLNVVEGSAALPLADWLRLPGMEEILL